MPPVEISLRLRDGMSLVMSFMVDTPYLWAGICSKLSLLARQAPVTSSYADVTMSTALLRFPARLYDLRKHPARSIT